MLDLTMIKSRYAVRTLDDSDVDAILEICRQNTLFYRYCEARPTKEQVLHDMKAAPPGIPPSGKAFFGFFEGVDLVAVMDLVDGYPRAEIAYIGFFMMNPRYQGKQIGSAIIRDTAAYLRSVGKTEIRLAIDRGNPQSTHFWEKNGFEVIASVDVRGWTKLVARKPLSAGSDPDGKTK